MVVYINNRKNQEDVSYLIEPTTEKRYHPTDWRFPGLIHGGDGSGASFATVVLGAELVRAGELVVWMCQKPAAIHALKTELALKVEPRVTAKEVTMKTVQPLTESQLVTMHGTGDFLLASLRALPDWGNRWVILKNIETTLSPALWHVLQSHPRLILSGDCNHVAQSFDPARWPTIMAFSQPPRAWGLEWSASAPYVGHLYRHGASSAIMAIDRVTKNPTP